MAVEPHDLEAFAMALADAGARLKGASTQTSADVDVILKGLGTDLEKAAQALGYPGGRGLERAVTAESPDSGTESSTVERTPS